MFKGTDDLKSNQIDFGNLQKNLKKIQNKLQIDVIIFIFYTAWKMYVYFE